MANSSTFAFPAQLEDRFEPKRVIGQSGRSIVYESLDRFLNRTFALKVTTLSSAGGEIVDNAAIEEQINAVASLRNPHIVPIYELVPIDFRRVALVLEMAEGPTLRQRVEDQRLDSESAVLVLNQVSNALIEVHQRGLVHGNISPDNLILQPLPNGEIFTRIIDFALIEDEGARTTKAFVGVPVFEAPEQLEDGLIGPEADIFALGASIFFSLTGQPPWTGKNLLALLHNRETTPPSLSNASADVHLWPELASLLMRMLALDPKQRESSATKIYRETQVLIEQLKSLPHYDEPGFESSPERESIVHCGLETDSSSVIWVDDENLVHRNGRRANSPEHGRITALCPHNGVLLGYEDGQVVRLWPDEETIFFDRANSPISAIDITTTHDRAIVGTIRGDVYRGTHTRNVGWRWEPCKRGGPVETLALTRTGDVAAIARQGGMLQISSDRGVQTIAEFNQEIRSLTWSADGMILLVLLPGTIRVFDVSGREVYQSTTENYLVQLRFRSDGQIMGLWKEPAGLAVRPVALGMGLT